MLTRYTPVLHPVNNAFWNGIVVGKFRKLSGEEFVICERPDHTIFVCLESQLLVYNPPQELENVG